jgi:hypothetical protein
MVLPSRSRYRLKKVTAIAETTIKKLKELKKIQR